MVDRRDYTPPPPEPPEAELAMEGQPQHERYLKLYLPDPSWQNDRLNSFNFGPKKEQKIVEYRREFAAAETYIVPIGVWGLGDSFMHLRYAIHLARATQKRVVCQVQHVLLPFAADLQRAVPNLELVAKVPSADIAEDNSFLVRFMGGGGNLTGVSSWAEGDEATNLQLVKAKQLSFKAVQLDDLTVPEVGEMIFPEPMKQAEFPESEINIADYTAGFVMQTLGLDVTAADIVESSIFTPSKEQVEAVTQDIDYLLVPDAKEMPDEHDFQSMKSLPLFAWRAFFAQLPRDKKVGIVLGVSHPQYCEAVIQMAESMDIQVEVIQGTLQELAVQYLRAKNLVGVDSGTTHLARDVQVAAKKHGRMINLKPIFIESTSYFPNYGIVENTSFVSPWITSVQQTQELNRFLLS